MNFYYYWYFFVYGVFTIFNNEWNASYFAMGMFLYFVFSIILACSTYISIFFDVPHIFLSYEPILFVCLIVGLVILNHFLFFYKDRHWRLFEKFKKVQTTAKDILCIIASIASLFLLFHSMLCYKP